MSKHEKLKPHIYLFDLMAEKTGLDLEVAVVEGEITPEEIVEAAFRCSDCGKATTCAAALPKSDGLKEPFEFCRNRSFFAGLSALKP